MLKLYYAENKYLEIGHLNINNTVVAAAANLMRKENYEAGDTQVPFSLPSEVKTLEEFYNTVTTNIVYPLFLDNTLTTATKLAVVRHTDNALSFHDLDVSVANDLDGCFECFAVPFDTKFTSAQLTSIYVSETSLGSNTEEYYFFIRQMIKYEREILSGDFPVGVNNLSDSILTSPFVLIKNNFGPLGFTVKPGYKWQYLKLNSFVNSANCYKWFTGKFLIPADSVYINDGGTNTFVRPAISYDPRKIDIASLHYNFDGANTLAINEQDVAYTLTYDNVTIDKFCTCDLCFVQMPEKFLTYNELKASLSYKPLYNAGWNYPSFLVSKESDPRLLNSYVVSSGDATYFYLQTSDYANLSKVCKEQYADDTYLSELDGRVKIPVLTVGFGFNINDGKGTVANYNRGFTTFRYAYGDSVGKITGSEYSSLIYNNAVQDFEDILPNYEYPVDDGNGGSSTTPSNGGNGTWKDSDDKTSIDPTASPSSDPTAPMPDSLGITGNYTLVKLNNAGLASLASQSWTESGWLDYITKFQGTSRIGEGVTDIKTCFVDITAGSVLSVSKIAGYPLATPITGNSIYQYSQYSFGSISIPKYFDSYLDFAPYTEFTLELPFGQPVQIPPEQIVGDSLSIILRVDALTGTALYYISNSKHLICQVPCNCFIDIPFASSEYTQSRNQALANTAISVGKMAYSAASQNYTGMMTAGIETAVQPMIENINQNASRNITEISSGGGPGAIGAMGIKYAVLKISRPYLVMPDDYYDFVGAPSGYIRQLSSCEGYFEVSEFYGKVSCNQDEYAEIVSQLRAGVFP